MWRRFLLAGVIVLAVAGSGLAAGNRVLVVGVLSDSHCGAKHATASEDAAKCVIACASGGADYVVVSEGKIYKFEKKNAFYKHFAGKNVEVVGNLTGDTFAMMDLGVAELTGEPPKNLQLFEGTLKSSGGKYTLESAGKVYSIDAGTAADKGESLPSMVGQAVEVVGSAEGDTIHLHDAQTR